MNVYAKMAIMKMMIQMNFAWNVIKPVKLVMEEILMTVLTVKLMIKGKFQLLILVYVLTDIMIMNKLNAINAITHGFYKIKFIIKLNS